MDWLAIDIGGANLKIADGQGFALSQHFPLYRQPDMLADALRMLIAGAPPADHLAITMTGELADCFLTKGDGVQQILAATAAAADGRHTHVYLCDGRLVSPQTALRNPLHAAASNWHALATFAARYVGEKTGLLIDIGSTTADLIPIEAGKPRPTAANDTSRLLAGELVYTGVVRSPVCAVVSAIPYRNKICPTAHEVFAMTWDAYLVLGELRESHETNTADGRTATKQHAQNRLARQICADRTTFSMDDARAASEAIRKAQLQQLRSAADQVCAGLAGSPTIVISGRGEFLGRKLAAELAPEPPVISLSAELGETNSRCATAHALAVLAREAV
jgi:hypothetical protein